MTDKKNEVIDLNKQDKKTDIVGVDVGTANICLAKKNEKGDVELSNIRNMYLPLEKNHLPMVELSNIDHVESEDKIFVIGEDAFNFSNLFNLPVRRPMAKGLISSTEIDSIDILTLILKQLVGKTKNGFCTYSIPANPIDEKSNVTYHQNVFHRIFSELGYRAEPMNEALSIVYSNCQENKFTGLSFSYGAGMVNTSLVFRSVPVISFSTSKSGDWIDEQASNSLGTVPNRVTAIKEKGTDLANFMIGGKKERRIREAVVYFYREVIHYSLEKVKEKLDESVSNIELPESLPIIVSGGTSLATGFLTLFNEVLSELKKDFPFQISEVKHASDPLFAVAEGLLIKGLMNQKKLQEDNKTKT